MRREFLELTGPVWGAGRAEALYDRVLDLERAPDVAVLAGAEELSPIAATGVSRHGEGVEVAVVGPTAARRRTAMITAISGATANPP